MTRDSLYLFQLASKFSEVKNCNPFANMIWTQTTRGVKFQGRPDRSIFPRQFLNHFKHHPQISNKMNLFANLHQICIEYKLNIFNFVPITFLFKINSGGFVNQVSHFFRFFKALKYFNFLREKEMWDQSEVRQSRVDKRFRNMLTLEHQKTFVQLGKNRHHSRTSRKERIIDFGEEGQANANAKKIFRPKTRKETTREDNILEKVRRADTETYLNKT